MNYGNNKTINNMRKRLIKLISIPLFLICIIPAILIQSVIWVINGNKTPPQLIEDYFTWLDS